MLAAVKLGLAAILRRQTHEVLFFPFRIHLLLFNRAFLLTTVNLFGEMYAKTEYFKERLDSSSLNLMNHSPVLLSGRDEFLVD